MALKLVFSSQTLEELTRLNSIKANVGYECTICGKGRNDFSAMKAHMEGSHFPSVTGYVCDYCDKMCKTKHALACHISRFHRQ